MSAIAEPAPRAPRVPTRWRPTFDGPGLLDTPFASRLRVRADDPRVARLRDALMEVDPCADALAEWMQEQPGARALFERAVAHGIDAVADAPEPLRAFFRDVDAVPPWLDRDAVRL